jgi:hypothetical protein
MTDGITSCDECGEHDPISGEWKATTEGVFGEWTCSNCLQSRQFSPEFAMAQKLALMLELKEAGYPFLPDDLTIDEWRLLGACAVAVRNARAQRALNNITTISEDEDK